MTTVPNGPPQGHPSAASSPPAPREWLAAARSHTEDLLAAALDATAPPSARNLGRRAARRIVRDAGDALHRLLAAAGAPSLAESDRAIANALPPAAPPPPPAGRDDDDAPAPLPDADREAHAREDRIREAQARTARRTREQAAELCTLRDARPNCPREVDRFPLVGALLYAVSTDDQDPLSGMLRALLGDVAALAVLAGDQDTWGQLTPALEGIERRIEVVLDLRRREIATPRAA